MCNSKPNKLINDRGFTIIEALVAMTLIAFLAIGISQSFVFGLSIIKKTEQMDQALALTQDKIEELKAAKYDSYGTGCLECSGAGPLPLSLNGKNNYARRTVVSYLDPNTLNTAATDMGLKKIDVSIYYRDPKIANNYLLIYQVKTITKK